MSTPTASTSTKAAVLRARAQSLAREPVLDRASGSVLKVVTFTLAGERYALESAYISEVHPLEDLVSLPCTPAFVTGLVNVRGRIFAVIDLKRFFDLPERGLTDLHRILLVRTADMEFGILADTVEGVLEVPLLSIQPSLPTLTGIRAEYLKGVTADRLVVLDAASILADRRIVIHDEVED